MEPPHKSVSEDPTEFPEVFDTQTRSKHRPHRSELMANRKKTQKQKELLEIISKALHRSAEELISESPSRYCIIVVGGTGGKVSQEGLEEVFKAFGEFVSFSLHKHRVAFVEYKSVSNAEAAKTALNKSICKGIGRKLSVEYLTQRIEFRADEIAPRGELAGIKNAIAGNHKEVPGLILIENFITEEEEKKLLSEIQKAEWVSMKFRRVMHFGYEFDYAKNNVDVRKPIGALPTFCDDVINRLKSSATHTFETAKLVPDQLTINEYEPGQGIRPHIDTHSAFESPIVSLSIESGVVMDFRHPNGAHVAVFLPPRSAVFLTAESRYVWTHGITARRSDCIEGELRQRTRRVSLTFRRVRRDACQCAFAAYCDSQLLAERKDGTTEVERKYVYEVYDKIASHFSGTRYKPWPKVESFLNQLAVGSIVADVGCGNGKYLVCAPHTAKLGCDRSIKLTEIAAQKSQAVVAECMSLPYRSAAFDAAISIAVIHHLSNQEHRLIALRELLRIVRVGGTVLVYVWAMEQEENTFNTQDLFVPWHLKQSGDDGSGSGDGASRPKQTKSQQTKNTKNSKKSEKGGEEPPKMVVREGQGDEAKNEEKAEVEEDEEGADRPITSGLNPRARPQKESFTTYHRYYHVFIEGELEALVNQLPNAEIIGNYYDHANWCVIVRRTM